MKTTIYELLGMVKDKSGEYKYVKYFDRVKEIDAVMWGCKENIIYKLDHSNIELNDEVEVLEEPKEIPEKLSFILHGDDIAEIPSNEMLMNKINEIISYLDYLESKGE